MPTTAVIGTVTITETHEITNRGFATASWYEVLNVTPGTYDIVATYRRNERTGELVAEPTDYSIKVDGVIVRDFFGSSFGGVGFGHYDGAANAGKATSYYHHLYGYQADRIAEVTKGEVTWAEGIEIQTQPIDSMPGHNFVRAVKVA